MDLRGIGPDQDTLWDGLVRGFPGGTLFHSARWLALLEKHQGFRLRRLGLYRGETPVGCLPLAVKRFGLVKVAGSPLVVEDTPYLGPVCAEDRLKDLWPALADYLRREGIHFLRIVWLRPPGGAALPWRYRVAEKHTHVLDLTRPEAHLWKGLEGRCRTAVRKAGKSGVTVEEGGGRPFARAYYPILHGVYVAQDMPTPNPRGLFEDLCDAFSGRGLVCLWARYRGEVIAGVIVLCDRTRAYYLSGASLHAYRHLAASNLLLWEAVLRARAAGMEAFDFVGSDIPRLARFKESFGGTLCRFSVVERAGAPWVDLMREQFPRYKRWAGNLLERLRTGSR